MKRSGFTTVELLIAISIIALLATLTFVGMKSVNRNVKSQATRITLQNTAGMLDEWSHANNGMVNLPVGPLNAANLSVRPDFPERTGNRILLTRAVFKRLLRVPSIAKMQQNLPQQTLFKWTLTAPVAGAWGNGTFYPLGQTLNIGGTWYICGGDHIANADAPGTPAGAAKWFAYDINNPTLLDTFGNPILFVPATGLSNVAIGGQLCSITSFGVVQQPSILPYNNGPFNAGQCWSWTDGKIYRASDAGTAVNPPLAPWVLQPSKPFFASAGPDGDFSKGDDNIYSFEN